jgi:hypothetical protein
MKVAAVTSWVPQNVVSAAKYPINKLCGKNLLLLKSVSVIDNAVQRVILNDDTENVLT